LSELERDIATTVGASEIAAILGQDPYRTAADVWRSKVEGERLELNEHMVRGICLENGLLDWWERLDGRKLERRQKLFTSPNGWACATCDGVVSAHIVEVKCPVGGKAWDDRAQRFPFHYQLQCVWQIGVASDATGVQHTAELCAGPVWGRLMRFPIQFDAALFALMLERAEEFMAHVRAGTPLPPAFTSQEAAL